MMRIEKAGVGRIGLIRELAGRIFGPTYREILSPEQSDYMFEMMYGPDNIRKQMERGDEYYIAFSGDRPFGYVSVGQPEERRFRIEKIYILPEEQGRGAGRGLIEAAFGVIREKCPSGAVVELNVNRYNKAKAFYERIGFRVVESGDFPIGNGYYMNDYIMRIEL